MNYKDYVIKLPNLGTDEKRELQEKINRGEWNHFLTGLTLGLIAAVAAVI